ncbi:MAG TPA: hypothetical protein VHS96_13605 [Bacteroidia bacterium]|nr:hypothetical protein [Bacteroidia bacterium]
MRLKTSSLIVLLLMVLAAGCADRTVRTFTANVPVYEDFATWRSKAITMESPRALQSPGRIYVYGNLLLVNEFMKGLHIFDNSMPSNPVSLGFIPLQANADIAVRENVLYLDSYTDLLSFDISDPRNPKFLTRVENVFEYSTYENFAYVGGYDRRYPFVNVDPSKGIIVGWTVGEYSSDDLYMGGTTFNAAPLDNFGGGTGNGRTSNLQSTGIAASTAKFAIQDNYLYALNSWQLSVFDVQSGIVHRSDVDLISSGFPETIFPAEGNLFIGTTMGMLIYSLSNPVNPIYLSQYDHGTGCDPVVVQGNYAFLTLSTGRACPGATNVLDVVDISNLRAPQLLYSFNMSNPRGLGVSDNTLFVCDGPDGLKVFDKTDLSSITSHMTSQFSNIVANDVIPMGNSLIMTSTSGIYQYDYSDLRNITQLSLIPVQQ